MTIDQQRDQSLSAMTCLGAILAGGHSRRMGTPKPLLQLGDRPLIEWVIDRLRPQVSALYQIGGDPLWAELVEIPFLEDLIPGSFGPLSGLLTALTRAEEERASHVILVATDMPFLPPNLVERLRSDGQPGRPAIPVSLDRQQPLASLWPVTLKSAVEEAIHKQKSQSFRDLFEFIEPCLVVFDVRDIDPFFNINTPADLERAAETLPDLED